MAFYVLSLPLSMAGMEAFSWGSLIVFLSATSLWFYRSRKNLLTKSGFEWPLFGYWIAVAIGAVFIKDLNNNDVSQMIGAPRWVLLFLFFSIVFQNCYLNKERLLKLFTIACFISAVYGVYQSQTGIDLFRNVPFKPTVFGKVAMWRSKGFFSSTMTYANSMGLAFTFLFGFQFLGSGFQNKKWKIFTYLTLIALGFAVLTSFTRGLWLGVLAGVLIISFLKKKSLGILAVIATLIFGTLLYNTNEVARERLKNAISTKHQSASERMDLWRSHWAMFKDHPIFGVGLNMSEKHIHQYHLRVNGHPSLMSHAHNNILQVLSSTGLTGFAFFSWFMIQLFVASFKKLYLYNYADPKKGILLGFLGALICLHVSGLTEANFFDGEVLHLFLFLAAYSLSGVDLRVNTEE